MLADDDEDDRELFSEAIRTSLPEADLNLAVNGNQLMQMLLASPNSLPDLLLLDLNMPIKNGKECLAEIRQNQRLSHMPVVIYSTSGHQEQIDEMYEQGADYYIRKPSSFSQLRETVQLLGTMPWTEHHKPAREHFILLQNSKYVGK